MKVPVRDEGGVRLREANPDDNRKLLGFTRECPMESDISLSIEREPDFFALSRARGGGRTLVAELGDKVVGCASVCRRKAYLRGEEGIMGYVGDIKVAPLFRRRGLAQRMLDELARGEADSEPAPYVGLTAAGNQAVDGLLLRFGTDNPLRRIAAFTSFQLLPFFRLRVEDRYEVRQAAQSDEAELIDLLDRYHRGRSFSPVFHNGGFREVLERSPGMDLSSYWIALSRGRIAAALAVWDEGQVKRTRVHRLTVPLRWVSRILGTSRKILPVPSFPTEGELLRFSYLRHHAHREGEIQALRALVRHAVNAARGAGRHFVMFTCSQADPVRQCLRGIPRTTYRYNLVVGTNHPGYGKELVHFENEPVFDDAALA